MHRLFSDQSEYRKNIRAVLAKRLSQISDADSKLVNFIGHALKGLDTEPENTVQGIRGIASRAMDLVFAVECPNGKIEDSWVSAWKMDGQYLANRPDVGNYNVPRSPYHRRELILLMTGDANSARVSQHVSKPTALLIDFLQRTGDFGQHIDDNEIVFEFAVTVCSAAIELCEHLARELPTS